MGRRRHRVQSTFFCPHSEAQFELRLVISTVPAGLNAPSGCHVIGGLAMWVNLQSEQVHPMKLLHVSLQYAVVWCPGAFGTDRNLFCLNFHLLGVHCKNTTQKAEKAKGISYSCSQSPTESMQCLEK